VAVEFVAPCVTATPMARQLPVGWRKLLGTVAEKLPEARWFELERHGFLVVELDATEARAHRYTVDAEDPRARAEVASAWRHPLARPGHLDPLDPDQLDPDRPDPVRPDATHRAGRPNVAVPGRPRTVLDRTERRRTRRRRVVRATLVAGAAALGIAGRRVRRVRRRPR
jgi:hypothetical protein